MTLSRRAALNMLHNFGIPLEMPLEGCTLSILKTTDAELERTPLRPYTAKIMIRARSPSEAKALQAILSLARTALVQGLMRPDGAGVAGELFASLFLVRPPEVTGSRIVITGAAMSASIIGRLAAFLFTAPRVSAGTL